MSCTIQTALCRARTMNARHHLGTCACLSIVQHGHDPCLFFSPHAFLVSCEPHTCDTQVWSHNTSMFDVVVFRDNKMLLENVVCLPKTHVCFYFEKTAFFLCLWWFLLYMIGMHGWSLLCRRVSLCCASPTRSRQVAVRSHLSDVHQVALWSSTTEWKPHCSRSPEEQRILYDAMTKSLTIQNRPDNFPYLEYFDFVLTTHLWNCKRCAGRCIGFSNN